MKPRAISWSGHRLRELGFHIRRWSAGSGPRVMIFPGGNPGGGASGLRGWSLAAPLRSQGFRVTVVPPQLELRQRQRIHCLERPDFVIFQKCRDPLHDPALFPGSRHILDVDDADYLDIRLSSRMQRVAKDCVAAVGGSRIVAEWLSSYCDTVRVIWTGSPIAARRPDTLPSEREPIVAFAASDLLRYEKETAFVRDVLLLLARDCHFKLQIQGGGDREQIGAMFAPIHAAGVPIRLIEWQPYQKMIKCLEQAAVGLAPVMFEPGTYSEGKSFGKVLAYLSASVPVVCSHAVEHPSFFRDGVTGHVLSNDPMLWTDRIRSLINAPESRDRMVAAARCDFQARLSADAAASQWRRLLHDLSGALGPSAMV